MATLNLDLSGYTIEQLEALRADAEKQLARLRQEKRRQALQQLDAMAKELGLSREDLAARYAKPARPPQNAVGLYRNPANPEQTWAGKGRKPVWVQDWLASGRSLEELAV
jgi:DNA-binding protein H-NS